MQTTVANLTLPAVCQVVCTLVATGITGINVISPATTTQTPSTIPEGYVAYPDIGFAYKVYRESVSWPEARKRCIEKNAQLAQIDSVEKVEYLKQQYSGHLHVGIIRMYDSKTWVGVGTGLPVSSLPWVQNEPTERVDYNCARVQFSPAGIFGWSCTSGDDYYVCEIPVTVIREDAMTVN